MGLGDVFEALTDILSFVLEKIHAAFVEFIYAYRSAVASAHQREYLPSSYEQYAQYHSTYGIAPGDSHTTDDRGLVVVADVRGPPLINAAVSYEVVESGEQHETGLSAFYHMVDRKT